MFSWATASDNTTEQIYCKWSTLKYLPTSEMIFMHFLNFSLELYFFNAKYLLKLKNIYGPLRLFCDQIDACTAQ